MKVYLRPISSEDHDLILNWENKPEFAPEIGYQGPFSNEDIRKLIQDLQDIRLNNQCRYIICIDEEAVGTIDFFNIDFNNFYCELGILVARTEYRRRGVATLAIEQGMRLMFNDYKLSKFRVYVHEDNLASQELFKKLNFQFVGTENQIIQFDHQYYNS